MRLVSARLGQVNQHAARPTLFLPFSKRDRSTRRRLSAVAALERTHEREAPVAHVSLLGVPASDTSLSTRQGRNTISRPAHGSLALSQQDSKRASLPISNTHIYGKWQSLLLDPDRLALESDFQSPATNIGRLVDHPDHAHDVALWSCIFNFRQRRGHLDGAAAVWRAILMRKCLYQVDGLIAQSFWHNVLSTALHDESFLQSTWVYAEWMYEEHGVQWPDFYITVLSFCMNNRQLDRAIRWHVRLSAHFNPDRATFFNFLKQFLLDPDPDMVETLQSIYVTSNHRHLYDTLIPYLWSHGHSSLARSWRKTLIQRNDLPKSLATRPFLEFISGYYPSINLCSDEKAVADADLENKHVAKPFKQASRLREEVYRAHGATFGIKEKDYSDQFGARLFASSWIPLDVAINVVHALGVTHIGPLSLQSIALREKDAQGVRQRINQLDSLHIGTGPSSYSKAVRQLATAGDSETLSTLLHSDLHPDVLEEPFTLEEILQSSVKHGDLQKYRLILTVRLALSMDSLAASSNSLLGLSLTQNKRSNALSLLEDMRSRGVQVLPNIGLEISKMVLRDLPSDCDPNFAKDDLDFYISLCRQSANLNAPLYTSVWKRILFQLAQTGRLEELEDLSIEIVDRYLALESSDIAMAYVHINDAPRTLPERPDLPGFRLVPRDLPLTLEAHPVQRLFDRKLCRAIVEFSFRFMVNGSPPKLSTWTSRGAINIADFDVARGVRLLRVLKDRGVNINDALVRREVLLKLAALYGPVIKRPTRASQGRTMRGLIARRRANRLSLAEVKGLCDRAWDGDLLGPLEAIDDFVKRTTDSRRRRA
ncbi:uncharacterized protein E0L32_004669 [Thyridium curvatum]|uniref:Pentatricopeptide repeat domain-containing protein n=1 Tax=Thyridium curvatum TaxID=1093900 RepID=A0A507BDU7_9PEZI|nr:uncharacterized protein E0L32_004669 [Thyridium curvatum]TPX15111.1 hypothetical protein E0L32_004669 [Thyridium curvatum]